MARWSLAALIIAFANPATAVDLTVEEVRANARKAAGYEAFQKLTQGITADGAAELLGIPAKFRMRLAPDGRYVRVVDARGEHSVGYDGTTRWGRNFSGPVRLLELEEGDRDRCLFGILCQNWLGDGAFDITVVAKDTSATRVSLTLSHKDAGVPARLALNQATWLPERLELTGATGPRSVEFSEYRRVAGVAVPARVVIAPRVGGQWIQAENIEAAEQAVADPYAVPVVSGGAKFAAVIAQVEAKRTASGLLLVRPSVNGKAVPWFVMDTGNGALTAMIPSVADQLGLPAFGGTEAVGSARVKTRFRQATSFTLGPATVKDAVLAEFPQDFAAEISRVAGVEVAGLVGWEFLLRAVVEIDHEAGKVAVHDPANYRLPPGSDWEPLKLNARIPRERGERGAIELLGDVERLAAVPLENRFQHLNAGLISLRQEARERPPHPAAHHRQRRLPLLHAQKVGDIGIFLHRGTGGQERHREKNALRHLPAESDRRQAGP